MTYSISITGATDDLAKAHAAYQACVDALHPLGAVSGSFYPTPGTTPQEPGSSELHGTTDPRSTQGGE